MRKIFYGWWIVAITFTIEAIKGGLYTHAFTLYFLPVTRDLGLTRAATSLVSSLSRLEGGLEAPMVGYLLDRKGPRPLMVIGGLLSGLGFILLSFSYSYTSFLYISVIACSE